MEEWKPKIPFYFTSSPEDFKGPPNRVPRESPRQDSRDSLPVRTSHVNGTHFPIFEKVGFDFGQKFPLT